MPVKCSFSAFAKFANANYSCSKVNQGFHLGATHLQNLIPGARPELTVILCTRNRSDRLERCLEYYEKIQTAVSWELLVVNNGSTDETDAVLDKFLNRDTLPLVVVIEPGPGLSRARNAGLRHATGEILCFSDDDCYPDSGFVDAWQDVFRNPLIDFGGGRIELFDPTDASITIKADQHSMFFRPKSFINPGTLHGASLAFRRQVIEAIGLFDCDLGAGTSFKSGEDSEYVQRASEWGFAGLYSPNPVVWHHHGRKSGDLPELFNGYQRGRGAFLVCVLVRSPNILWRAFLNDVRNKSGLLGYVKSIYWQYRRDPDFPRYIRNTFLGIAEFALLLARRTDKPHGPVPRGRNASTSLHD